MPDPACAQRELLQEVQRQQAAAALATSEAAQLAATLTQERAAAAEAQVSVGHLPFFFGGVLYSELVRFELVSYFREYGIIELVAIRLKFNVINITDMSMME